MTSLPSPAPKLNQRPFVAVAHRGGNNLHDLEEALAAGVDAIECDYWHDDGRLALRHERKLPALPVLYDRWYVRWSGRRLSLPALLRAIDHRASLFLDIKSSSPRAADAVLDLYHDHTAMMPRADVSSRQWKLLDRLAAAGTSMRMFYSVGDRRGIDALLRRVAAAPHPAGTSIRHTLLSESLVRRLHDAGLAVYAWSVNDHDRAERLIEWGVDGIISDKLHVFSAARSRATQPQALLISESGALPSP